MKKTILPLTLLALTALACNMTISLAPTSQPEPELTQVTAVPFTPTPAMPAAPTQAVPTQVNPTSEGLVQYAFYESALQAFQALRIFGLL